MDTESISQMQNESSTNQKIENVLSLALKTPEQVREKSLNLNVGFHEETGSWELIVKYNGSLERIAKLSMTAEDLIAGYAILTVSQENIDAVSRLPEIEYVEKPKRLFFSVTEGKEVSCILPVTKRQPFLSGKGVITAVIDSGIEYTNRHFRTAGGDSRILFLWDQTIAPDPERGFYPPEGFYLGTEFRNAQISAALKEENPVKRYELVPSTDTSGHGTAVAGIAAGSAGNGYEGVAPESELIVVKLGIPAANSFPRTTELMRALTYVVKKAQALNRPLAVNLSFGNTYGAHDGSSLLERFMDNICEIGRTVICVGSGNEAASGGHAEGIVSGISGGQAGSTVGDGAGENTGGIATGRGGTEVELSVGSFETAFSVQIWKQYTDQFRIILRSPGGEDFFISTGQYGKMVWETENTRILIYVGEPAPFSVVQEIYFDFIPLQQFISPGIWSFRLYSEGAESSFYFYLPSAAARNANTRFFTPTPNLTLTIPSTATKVITVGAYDSTYDAYADFSGRGYRYAERDIGLLAAGAAKPDLAAPGVSITAPDLFGGYASFTGTSFATPFVTGAAALLMEWGIIQGNDPFLYGEKVKAYLRRGARPIRGETQYPNDRVGYGALCVEKSIPTE